MEYANIQSEQWEMTPNSSLWQNFSVILDKIIRTIIIFPLHCNKLEQERDDLIFNKGKVCVSDRIPKAFFALQYHGAFFQKQYKSV